MKKKLKDKTNKTKINRTKTLLKNKNIITTTTLTIKTNSI